jgi:hypothetical protein
MLAEQKNRSQIVTRNRFTLARIMATGVRVIETFDAQFQVFSLPLDSE